MDQHMDWPLSDCVITTIKCFNTSSIKLFLYLFFPKIKTWLIVWCPLEERVRIKSKHELTDIEF